MSMQTEVMNPNRSAAEKRFDWPVCYEAEELVSRRIDAFLQRNRFAHQLARRMRDETGTAILDWTDFLTMSTSDEPALRLAGFAEDPLGEADNGQVAWHHPDALLPRVHLVPPRQGSRDLLALRVESVADFMAAHGITGEPEGSPLARFRRMVVSEENETQFQVVERRGYRGFVIHSHQPAHADALLKALELWHTRARSFIDSAEGYRQTHALLDRIIEMAGRDLACHVVFEGERAYWERRNRAAQVQRHRQNALGLGWANHDHHTFRSSRERFVDLMSVMEKLGFERRERYYAGAQAGWGAQILEQPVEGIVAFCDLDLMPEETEIDFSRQPLAEASKFGTVGLWVALHGESFLEAGMHHLEARFDFALVRQQLKSLNIHGMPPFSDFDFLRQAFTEGERWPVRRERAERLLHAGLISPEQCQRFVAEGAIGSHLETLQRRGGFKGFNQKSVSAIIHATDPRLALPNTDSR